MMTIAAIITLLPTECGGRKTAISSGYRPQIFIFGEDFECRGIDVLPDRPASPRETFNAAITLSEHASQALDGRIWPGATFSLREGAKVVAGNVVSGIMPTSG